MKLSIRHIFNPGLVRLLLVLSMILSLWSCSEKEEPSKAAHSTPEPAPVALEGDDQVLARVNGSPISRYDVDLTISTTLAKPAAAQLGDEGRKKVLESLVSSRAIAQAQEGKISPVDLAVIEKKTAAFREQLLVKQYLAENVAREPVPDEMVKAYYEKHPDRFGAKTIRTFEMIRTSRELSAQERDNLLAALKAPEQQKNWQRWVEQLKKKKHPVTYQNGVVNEEILQPRLADLMRPLKPGETSQLHFIKGTAYVVRIIEEKEIPPRPLAEVSAGIRKALVPVQLKKAVKQASDEVMKTAELIYY